MAYDLIQTNDEGFVLAGSIAKTIGSDMLLIKTDPNGIQEWNLTYGGSESYAAYALLQTPDQAFVITGRKLHYNGSGFPSAFAWKTEMWLTKISSNGAVLWSKTYSRADHDGAVAIVQTDDKGFVLAGYSTSFDPRISGAWLIKTDANGIMQWNQFYVNAFGMEDLIQTTDGGFALAGGLGGDMWLMKVGANGVAQWNQTYRDKDLDRALGVVQTGDNGFALAGYIGSKLYDPTQPDSSNMWLVKTDENGIMQWNKTYGGTKVDGASSLVQTADGGFSLAGSTQSYGQGKSDLWLVKTDRNGVMQWNLTYGGTEHDSAQVHTQTVDGGFALVGSTHSFEGGDIWLVKTGVPSKIAPGWEILPLMVAIVILVGWDKKKRVA
ncbi:MAG: hypothetical protein ACFE95_02980 [Candidatus Hodarchaeota archaeon]